MSRHSYPPLSLTLEIFALRVKGASGYCLCCTEKFLRV
nr:MAG TPA: DBF DBF zinc finger [Caudoviricetes sp.]